jgi:hypothetical protein
MVEEEKVCEAEKEAVEASKPVGDFIAQIAAAICVVFTFLTFYNQPPVFKGYETPYGIIIMVFAALCWLFASAVLWAKFLDRDFWLARSPGWFYMASAGVVMVISIIAMVFPYKNDPNYGAMVGTLFTGLFMAFGGLLKF